MLSWQKTDSWWFYLETQGLIMNVKRINLPTNLTEGSALEFIGEISAVCTGASIENKQKNINRGKRNLTEAYGGTPTRAWEFLPVWYMDATYYNFRGYMSKYGISNLKVAVNEYNDRQVRPFHIFHITAPRYVMAHLKTHTTLSSMMSSVRIGCNGEKEYEFPEIEQNFSDTYDDHSALRNNDGGYFYNNHTGQEFKASLEYFYKRKEITKRPLSDFEVVEMKICGYADAWDWFIKQRTEKGVQKETQEIANMIKEIIDLAEGMR